MCIRDSSKLAWPILKRPFSPLQRQLIITLFALVIPLLPTFVLLAVLVHLLLLPHASVSILMGTVIITILSAWMPINAILPALSIRETQQPTRRRGDGRGWCFFFFPSYYTGCSSYLRSVH